MKYLHNEDYASAKECTKCHKPIPTEGYYSEQAADDAEYTGFVYHLDAKGEGIVCEECAYLDELRREAKWVEQQDDRKETP
jgi:hypothetical protein